MTNRNQIHQIVLIGQYQLQLVRCAQKASESCRNSAPLYFVRSGFVSISNSKLRFSGQDGYDWSSMSYSTTNGAYYLNFSGSGVSPSNLNDRWFGFPLRCLAS